MITVVIPVYNAAEYIQRCIASLEGQTRRDFKVVFIDDCSKDDSVDILQKSKVTSSLDITIIRNDINRGPAYSRNEGILNAQSELITFCDCDDWYAPEFIEKMAGLLEGTKADIVFCGYKVVNEKMVAEERPLNVIKGVVPANEVIELDVDSLCMMMTKTSLMKNTLLPDLRNGEDVAAVSLLLAKSHTVAATNECLYNYFRRSGSASESPSSKVVNSIIESFEYTKKIFPEKNKSELEFLGIKNMLYPSIISLFSFSYDIAKAKNILNEFEKNFPKWNNNEHIKKLNNYKKVVLYFLHIRFFAAIRVIAFLRKSLLR